MADFAWIALTMFATAVASAEDSSLVKAQALFDQLAADPLITFQLPESGCEKRSYLMKKTLVDQGIATQSFVIVSNDPGKYKIRLAHPSAPMGKVAWNYHTLPVVQFADHELYALDPSVFKGPVTLAAAVKVLDPKGLCPQIGLDKLKKRFHSTDDFNSYYGNSKCYWFLAAPYYYSPMHEDLSMHEQFQYSTWNEDFLADSRATMLDCRDEQRARIQMLEAKQQPQESAQCLIE